MTGPGSEPCDSFPIRWEGTTLRLLPRLHCPIGSVGELGENGDWLESGILQAADG